MAEPRIVIHILAFDFGLKMIGVAVGQSITGSASPLPPLPARGGRPQWSRVSDLIRSWSVNQLVVGLPLNMDDTESDMSARARSFAAELERRYQLPVAMIDERLTSREALMHVKGDREQSHGMAAALIAETWLRSL